MFAFTIDHRHSFEPTLQMYRASRSAKKANARDRRTPKTSSTAEAPPPAYTPTAAPTTSIDSSRRGTSGSTATISSTASSMSSTSSTSGARSKLARLNPFRRHQKPNPLPTTSSSSQPNLNASSTSSSTSSAATRAYRRSRAVHFADPYDSDASSVYSTDFPPSQQPRNTTKSAPNAATAATTSGTSRTPYPRNVDENSTYPAFLFLF